MKATKERIRQSFIKNFGFAPAPKEIRFLEASTCEGRYLTIGFHVNGIGYLYKDDKVTRAKQYDM